MGYLLKDSIGEVTSTQKLEKLVQLGISITLWNLTSDNI